MYLTDTLCSLRCHLCRRGLLGSYQVYRRQEGQFGLPGSPVLHAATSGYFFAKRTRHYDEVLEIAGDLAERVKHDFRLLAFDDHAALNDLILIADVFYRVVFVRDLAASCRLLELEEEHCETPH